MGVGYILRGVCHMAVRPSDWVHSACFAFLFLELPDILVCCTTIWARKTVHRLIKVT